MKTQQVISLVGGAVLLAVPLLALASAQDAGTIAQNVTNNYSALARGATGGGYLVGSVAILHGIHKFWQKAHDRGGDIKAGHYGIPIVAGGAFIAMAATAGVPVATIFGSGANSSASGTGVNGTTTY